MAPSPSHRSTYSMSQTSLLPPDSGPTPKQQRRMTSPASNSSLNLPQEARRQPVRPPSPLRNAYIPDTSTGIAPGDIDSDDDDEDHMRNHRRWKERSPSPSSSVSNLAASFKERVGTFLGSMTPRSPASGSMPSDAELEADAERERDRSRRQAEEILTREAAERRRVEERVLAMMENTRGLPPPPSRSQTMSNPPSPSGSQKERDNHNWWTAAKNRLTPTKDKESLTPAQQIIQDTKAKEKDSKKGKGKEKERDEPRYSDPAALVPPPHRKPIPSSPSSPTPSRPSLSNMPPNLTPSPMRSTDGLASSPSREAPPLYAQFNAQGTLDVPGTLLTIARRFEKLEKWTVGHVRALEERMSDVERWLVDKEKQKEPSSQAQTSASPSSQDLLDIRDGMTELQGRVTELGREMARIAISPSNLSSGPTSYQPGPISTAPTTTSSIITQEETASLIMSPFTPSVHSRLSSTARESTSPPITSARNASGTRLPYPTGDYAAPESTSGPSTPSSPPGSITKKTRPLSVAGGKGGLIGLGISTPSATPPTGGSPAAVARATSPPVAPAVARTTSPPITNASSNSRTLPAPPNHKRQSSVSPTPRKRYTVALGEPIVSPPDFGEPLSASVGTAFFTTWDGQDTSDIFSKGKSAGKDKAKGEDEESAKRDEFEDDTIGKSASARFTNSSTSSSINNNNNNNNTPSPSSRRRIRAQSAYGGFSDLRLPPESSSDYISSSTSQRSLQAPVTPLRPKIRSKSSERLGGSSGGDGGVAFVDPLVLRRQERQKEKGGQAGVVMPKPLVGRKVPVGQLVAFFDKEKR